MPTSFDATLHLEIKQIGVKKIQWMPKYSGDPITGHSVNGNILLTDFTVAGSLLDKIYRTSE